MTHTVVDAERKTLSMRSKQNIIAALKGLTQKTRRNNGQGVVQIQSFSVQAQSYFIINHALLLHQTHYWLSPWCIKPKTKPARRIRNPDPGVVDPNATIGLATQESRSEVISTPQKTITATSHHEPATNVLRPTTITLHFQSTNVKKQWLHIRSTEDE